jgi:hypothetical protein
LQAGVRSKDGASPRVFWFSVLLVSVLVGVIYSLPQILYFLDGGRRAVNLMGDEFNYAARVQRVLNGYPAVGNPYLFEHRFAHPVISPVPEWVLARLGAGAGLSVDGILIASRFLFSLLGFGLLVWVGREFGLSPALSLVGAALGFLEPGTFESKPWTFLLWWTPWKPGEAHLVYNRLVNPLVNLVPFLACVGLLRRALTTDRLGWQVAAGILLGAQFYTSVFYWGHLFAGLAVLLVVGRLALPGVPLIRRSLVPLAVAALVSIPYWVQSASLWKVAHLPEMLIRYPLNIPTHQPWLLFPKGLLLVLALYVAFGLRREVSSLFLFALLLGGYLALNQNVVTGREMENAHFKYTIGLFSTLALLAALRDAPSRLRQWRVDLAPWGSDTHPEWRSAGWKGVTVAATLVWLLGNAAVLQAREYRTAGGLESYGRSLDLVRYTDRLRETLAFLEKRTAPDSVILASLGTSKAVAIYTRNRVWVTDDSYAYPISDAELFDRWAAYFAVAGLTPEEVGRLMDLPPTRPLMNWPYGMPPSVRTALVARRGSNFFYDHETTAWLARALRDEYARLTPEQIRAILRRYRLDYVATCPMERATWKLPADRWLRLTPVYENPAEGCTIYRVEPA